MPRVCVVTGAKTRREAHGLVADLIRQQRERGAPGDAALDAELAQIEAHHKRQSRTPPGRGRSAPPQRPGDDTLTWFGPTLKRARERADPFGRTVSQQSVADLLARQGIPFSRAAIAKIETAATIGELRATGLHLPPRATVSAIADMLRIDAQTLWDLAERDRRALDGCAS